MTDRFLGTGASASNLANGTATIYAATLGAISLNPSMPVKTNSVRQLVSSPLLISDVSGLQSRLNGIITNPFNGNLNVQNLTTGVTPGTQVDLNAFIASAITDSGNLVNGNIVSASGAKTVADSGIVTASIVIGPASAVSGNVATFSGTTGKLIADSGTSLSSYLPLAGGTMTGAINMGSHNITGVASIVPSSGILIGSSVVDVTAPTTNIIIGNSANGSAVTDGTGVIIGVSASGTGASPIAIGEGATAGASDAVAIGYHSSVSSSSGVALGWSAIVAASAANAVAIGAAAQANKSAAVAVGNSAFANAVNSVALGAGSSMLSTADNSIVLGYQASSSVVDGISLGNGTSNAVANSFLFGDSAIVNIRPNSAVCDLGTSGAKFQNLYLSANIIGSAISTPVNNIVSNSGTAVSGNVATFSGTTGKLITDSGASLSSYLPLAGGTMTGNITLANGTTAGGAQYSMHPLNGPVVTNTTAASTLLGGTSLGTMSLPANWLPAGSVARFRAPCFLAASGGGGNLTFAITLGGSSIWSYTLTPAGATNAHVRIEVDIVNSDGGSCGCYGTFWIDGSTPVYIVTGSGAWSSAVAHTLSFTAQWSVASASNQIQANAVFMDKVF